MSTIPVMKSLSGGSAEDPDLRILHYPIRGYEALQLKVANVIAWSEANPHLQAHPGWG